MLSASAARPETSAESFVGIGAPVEHNGGIRLSITLVPDDDGEIKSSSPVKAAVLDAVADLMPTSTVDTSLTMFMLAVEVALLLLVSVSLKLTVRRS